jgi:nucleotide-binding universal stress UspA family protein
VRRGSFSRLAWCGNGLAGGSERGLEGRPPAFYLGLNLRGAKNLIRPGRLVLVFDLVDYRWERLMYRKVLLAYDGSIEGRRALREGAKLAQLCRAEVFLLAVVEISSIMTPEAGLAIPIEQQADDYKAILNEGTERLKALGFSPTSRLEVGDAGQKIAEVAEQIGAHLVVVGHRPQGPLARWFGSVGSYLVKRLRCSVLVAQTEISDDEFEQLKPPMERAASG